MRGWEGWREQGFGSISGSTPGPPPSPKPWFLPHWVLRLQTKGGGGRRTAYFDNIRAFPPLVTAILRALESRGHG